MRFQKILSSLKDREKKWSYHLWGWKQKKAKDEKLNPDRPQEKAPKKGRQQERQRS